MTKLNECSSTDTFQPRTQYVNEVWNGWRHAREQALGRITNYLFVLNTGGLLAALTYVASKGANQCIQASIWLLAFGSFFCAVHAALDYYVIERSFAKYRTDVKKLYENQLDWEVLVGNVEMSSPYDKVLHVLGWLSGIVFFVGLVLGILQIPSK